MGNTIRLVVTAVAGIAATARGGGDYSKQLASPNDGRLRPSSTAGLEEAYLTPLFASAHAANLLRLKSGDLLCFWFSGSWEGKSDVAIVVSRLARGSKFVIKSVRFDESWIKGGTTMGVFKGDARP